MATININGIIGKNYTYKQFITDYANCNGEPINLFINSVGGSVDDGDAIAEFVKSHSDNFLSVINTGDVASIAASIFLALPYEKRFFDLSKGVALIHQPFFKPTIDTPDMTSEVMQMMAAEMMDKQKEIQSFITKQTGADTDVVKALMAINEPLDASQLESIKFANLIKFQAVAYFNNNKKENMDKEFMEKTSTVLDKIVAWLTPKNVVAVMLTDANGAQIEFPEVAEGTMPIVGDKVTAPDGELVMADGNTYVVLGGVITEIKPKEEGGVTVEVESLKAELESAKAELAAMKAQGEQMAAFKAEVVNLKSQIKSQMIDVNPTEKDAELASKNNRITNLKDKFKNK